MTAKYIAEIVRASFKAHLESALQPILSRLKALEDRPAVPADLEERLLAAVTKAVAAIPPAKDGTSVEPEAVRRMIAEAVQKAGEGLKSGEPGRDGVQIDPLPYIEPDRSYGRGTYASHHGGLVRAARTTDYLDTLKASETIETKGWQIILNGVHEHSIEQLDERTFAVKSVMTSGQVVEKRVAVPAVIDRGVYRQGEKYLHGDAVTYGGSLWIGQKDAPPGKPGDHDSGWRLAVKKGRDAKDGHGHR